MKKWIAPILVTVLMVAYLAVYFGVLIWVVPSTWLKVLLTVPPIAMAAVMVGVCIQRIKEIRSGEEDDLSQY